jgi:hypothetical protein
MTAPNQNINNIIYEEVIYISVCLIPYTVPPSYKATPSAMKECPYKKGGLFYGEKVSSILLPQSGLIRKVVFGGKGCISGRLLHIYLTTNLSVIFVQELSSL